MSIGLLKRLLILANVAALLVLGGAAYGYWTHSRDMSGPASVPDFRPEVISNPIGTVRIEDIQMTLGRYQDKRQPVEAGPVEEKPPEIEALLKQIGEIVSAVVVYPPYRGILPSITFKLRNSEDTRTIQLGEALITKPHPEYGKLYQVPVRAKFIGCEPDPENPDWTFFRFDMNCDGEHIEKARWYLEEAESKGGLVRTSPDAESGMRTIRTPDMVVIRSGEDRPKPAAATPDQPVEPALPQPVEVVPVAPREAPSRLFEDESGTWEPTREGVEYLKNNYEELIGDAQASTWRDPDTGRPAGVRVSRIKDGSAANAFGILQDDVILAVNDVTVSSKDQAVSVVKRLLRQDVNIIRVKVLRLGRTLELRYDTRDPDTRRAARSALK